MPAKVFVTSAFFPLVIYYQTSFYRRGELARRLAIFYAASNIAYAFGGLLAFGVFHIQGGALPAWKYLFILEGSLSMCFAVVAFIFLPYSAAHARFLNEEEKKLAFYRIQVDSSAIVNEKFNLREAVQILRHPTSWVILGIEICLGVPLQGVSLFLPQIVERLGYRYVTVCQKSELCQKVADRALSISVPYRPTCTQWRPISLARSCF